MQNHVFQKALLSLAITLSTAGAGLKAVAQPGMLEEVIVMAQKRQQSLQDVGITISAYTSETLDALGVVNSNELAAITPNLNIMSPAGDGGVVAVFIRGIGLNDFALNNTGPVGFYVDEVFVGSSNSQVTTLFDIERVEILKGPQGTLFGRNTTGGALNFISNKPEEEFGVSAKMSAGNYGYYKGEGAVTGALTDTMNGRLALVGYGSDGYVKNLSTGDEVDKKNYSGRALLDYNPREDLSILLNLHGARNDSDSDLYGTTTDDDFYEGTYGLNPYHIKVDTYGGSAKVGFDFSDSVTLTSISGYDSLDKTQDEEADMTPLQLVEFVYEVDSDLYSQELRLNGSRDSTHWIAGLYYLSETIDWDILSDNSDLPIIPGILDLGFGYGKGHQELTTVALFGQVEYEFTDQWAVTVGGRYTYLEVDFENKGGIPNFELIGYPATLDYSEDMKDGQFSGKIALNYFHDNDQMYYASVTKGFKGGGFNGGVISDYANYPATAEYDPETLYAYELGLKSTLMGGSMRVNAAAFYYDYQDAQVFNSIADPNTGLPQNQVENAGSLELYGLDLDLTWQPTTAFSVTAGLGYTHSEFSDFDLTVPTSGGTSSVDLSGETPQNTPEWSAMVLASYTWSMAGMGYLTAYVDGSYQSRVFYSNGTVTVAGDPSSYTRNKEIGQDAFSLWNARIAWMDTSEQWEVAMWGKNLGDKEYATYMFELSDLIGADQVMRGVPLTYGIDVRYVF